MGKKARAKGRSARRANPRVPASSPRSSIAKQADPVVEAEVTGLCKHFNGEDEAVKSLLLRIQSSYGADDKCEDCRGEVAGKKVTTVKRKNAEKRGGASKRSQLKEETSTVWVCLDCNRLTCGGGIAGSREPYGHARRHSKLDRHDIVVRLDNPTIAWCFACNSSIPIAMPVLQNESADKDEERKTKENGSLPAEKKGGYSVRGLTNLGNTCFFNSVTQNLLAMEKLRSYFVTLDQAVGPLTMAMKKLFLETSSNSDSIQNQKSRITPNNLFGCVCAKAPQFKGYQQQDSHELLRYLLDGLSTEHSSITKSFRKSKSDKSGTDSEENQASAPPAATFVDSVFGGQLSSTVCCTICGHSSVVFEPFLDLSLPIPWKKPPHRPASLPLPKKGKSSPRSELRGRGRKVRERKPTMATPKLEEESINSVSESNPPLCSVKSESETVQIVSPAISSVSESNPPLCSVTSEPETEKIISPAVDDDFWWLNFVGPTDTSDNAQPSSQASINFVHGPPQREEDEDEEEIVESGPEFQSDACSSEVAKPQDHLPAEVSSVILLPYGPKDEISSAEADFNGFGDLFNEEEGESAPASNEDYSMSWFGGNSCESNHEEIDSSDAPVSIDRCLAYFTTPELLSDEQAWDCENCSKVLETDEEEKDSRQGDSQGADSSCVDNGESVEGAGRRKKTKRDATKRILIDKAPCVLTVHLKRFSQDARGRLSKLNGHISFQEALDLRPYMNSRDVKGSLSYRLVGVVEHEGSMRGGHYVAYVRGEKAQEEHGSAWFYASDALVKQVSLSEVLQSEAYLLFYERV